MHTQYHRMPVSIYLATQITNIRLKTDLMYVCMQTMLYHMV